MILSSVHEERVILGKREEKRAVVLNRLVAGQLTSHQAAELLGLSSRQLRRVKAGYARDGPASLVHGNRGRAPAHRLTDTVRQQVLDLARGKYRGLNHQHLTEKLVEDEQLLISRMSVHRLLREAGLVSPRSHRPAKHRQRRERMPQEGMLLQADGSRHRWFGPDGPYLTLIGGIDDATGIVPGAVFRDQEDAAGYMGWLQGVVNHNGVPLALYVDRHGIFRSNARDPRTLEEQLLGSRLPTQFGRALEELDIRLICAQTPQAKGRIERLWGSFQDRLVSELRLAQVSTMAAANAFLPGFLERYNQRFAVPAATTGSAYRALPATLVPEHILCFKYARTVAADNTVRLGEHRLQILPGADRPSYAQARVEVQERLDGSLAVYFGGTCLATQPAPLEAPILRARQVARPPAAGIPYALPSPPAPCAENLSRPAQIPARPAADHPWRRSMVKKSWRT